MPDEASLALLQEIRDLQKQQVEYLRATITNQQQALANQQQSLAVQQGVVERQKKVVERSSRIWIFLLLGFFVLFFLQSFPFLFRLLLHPLHVR